MESLWPEIKEQRIERNFSIQILRAQARAIKSETNSVVNATFSKMNYKSGPLNALNSLGQVVSAVASPIIGEELEEELADKKDVNELFGITDYKFEIYNSKYRFRLFILKYREMFPISLDVDEGILENIQYKNNSPISSNAELKETLKEIFSSNKVRSVVAKMLQENKGDNS